jgi:hypothetical protein
MQTDARELVLTHYPGFDRPGKLVADTTEFMRIGYGDVIQLGGLHYLVRRDEAECRFGLEDPKFWVKRCRCLETAEPAILKLVFHESFPLRIGPLEITCFRSPRKEARILDLVRDDFRFMQGLAIPDAAGNTVRVLEVIRGKPIDIVVDCIDADHETYFRRHFPEVLGRFIGACEAIGFLHQHGEKHGDVRRDHLFIESRTGQYRWIDFDYTFQSHESPYGLDLFGLGNILLFIVGKRIHSIHDMGSYGFGADVLRSLTQEDMSIMFPYRVMNLRKLYPYVPEELNRVLMHFSAGSSVYYETVDELLDDLRPVHRTLAADRQGGSQ